MRPTGTVCLQASKNETHRDYQNVVSKLASQIVQKPKSHETVPNTCLLIKSSLLYSGYILESLVSTSLYDVTTYSTNLPMHLL
jgi:hypothetical protein